VRRRDSLVSLLAHFNRCVFWFHPLAWWLARTLAATAEHACDEAGIHALGESRKYAEILLDLAEAVRRRGGRFSWQGVGMDGSGLLGYRIDRILRGDLLRGVSRTRKTVVALGCAASIFLIAACRQPAKPAALQDDPQIAQSRARSQTDQESLKAAREMNAGQAAELEAALAKNPEDARARQKLLMFYSESGTQVIGEEKTIAARRRHAFWLIEHHPDSELAGTWGARIFPTAAGPHPDPAGYAQAKRLWLAQTERPDTPVPVLTNAALFFDVADKPLAEKMLLRAQALDPQGHWAGRLGRLYYEILVGSNASMPMGVVRSVSLAGAHGPYANQIRKKLADSTDAGLLSAVGDALITWGGRLYQNHHIDFDPLPLGKSYLEKALQLDPRSIRAHEAMFRLRAVERGGEIPAIPRNASPESQYQALSTLPEPERFVRLSMLAESAYIRGDMDDYYRHDQAAAKAGWQLAGKYARESLRLAPKFRNHPDYGTALYKANMVLGMLAMRDGNRKAAVQYMLEASKAPGSEELAYSMDFFTFKLPGWLLKDGERDSVIEFLERFARVSISQKDYLLESARLIRNGRKPPWYQDYGSSTFSSGRPASDVRKP